MEVLEGFCFSKDETEEEDEHRSEEKGSFLRKIWDSFSRHIDAQTMMSTSTTVSITACI